MEKLDIDDKKSDLETKDEQSDWNKEINESFLYEVPKNPPFSVLKWDNSGEKNLWGAWDVDTKRTQRRKEKQQRKLKKIAQKTRSIGSMFAQ